MNIHDIQKRIRTEAGLSLKMSVMGTVSINNIISNIGDTTVTITKLEKYFMIN